MASANMKESIIVMSILADADGFLESPFTDANPTSAITKDGPSVLMSIIAIITRFFKPLSFFRSVPPPLAQQEEPVGAEFSEPVLYGEEPAVL